MNPRLLLITAFLLIIGGSAIAIFYAQYQTQDPEIVDVSSGQTTESPGSNSDHAKVVGEQVTFTITEGVQKRWEILVQQAYYYQNNKGARLKGVTGTLFNDEGKPTARFTAPTGDINQESKAFHMTGGVEVRSIQEEGTLLQAPEMRWSPKTGQVVANGGVHLFKKGFGESTADSCRFSMDFTSIALEGNAQSHVDL